MRDPDGEPRGGLRLVNIDEALDFARDHHRAVLATTSPSGRLQLTPVAVAVDATGAVILSTRETAVKTANLRRTGRATVLVMNDGFFGTFAQLEGQATVVSLPEALEGLVEYYRLASGGEHPDWDEYAAAMVAERRVLVRIAVDHAGPSISG
jgi:PPOX class probable F420-dependent enzyme